MGAPCSGVGFAGSKPLSQIHRSTLLPLQDTDPTPSFGGFGLRETLRAIEGEYPRPVSRQFDFEMSVLGGRHGRSPAQAFWAAGASENGYHPCWQPLSTEICLSSYLRTLAWAASNEVLPQWLILAKAATVSPIDLGLWSVRSAAMPDWWPRLGTDGGPSEIDKETVTIIRKTESAMESWRTDAGVVLAASGCLSQTSLVQHDLQIRAFFQRAEGPDRPTSQGLFECLRSVQASVCQELPYLRFGGAVTVDTHAKPLSDWLVVPCSGSSNPVVPIIWQRWRGMRQVQCPSDVLADSEMHAVCRSDSIDYESGEGLIARWSDWSRGMSALAVEDLLPASGWILVAPTTVVDRFAEETGMRLAWAWEIASHFREHSSGKFTELRMHYDRGTTRVVLPPGSTTRI